MHDSLETGKKAVFSFLKTRTGFLGLGPTNGEIIATAIVGYFMTRHQEKTVVKEAENILAEINERNKGF